MEKQLYADQVKQLERLAPMGMAATLANAVILVLILWRQVPPSTLITWLLVISLITLPRYPRFYRNIPALSRAAHGGNPGRFFVSGAAVSGVAWGAAGIFLFPVRSIAHQVFLAFVVGGMVAGAVAVYSVLLPAFLAFSLPALSPLILRFFLVGDEIHVAMGAMASLFAVIMAVTARRFNAATLKNFKLTFEKGDLVEHLQEEIRERKKAEQELKKNEQNLSMMVEVRTAELSRANVHLQEEIRERKRLEGELVRREKLESLGILAGGIAHDFNNLLTGILGNISLAKIDRTPGEGLYEILSEAEKASLQAKGLTQQLLTFSKGGEPVKKAVSMKDLIKEAVNFVLRGSSVKCDFDLQKDLYIVEVDAGQMGQVLRNLVINSVQAMPGGGVIRITAENVSDAAAERLPLPDGRYIRLTIRDEGKGIPEEDLPRIFDPYFSTKDKGTGLGLATTYAIIRKHGGYVKVESQMGAGTTVFVYLPASQKSAEECGEDEGKIPAGGGRILVMDDDQVVRGAVHTMLVRLGYQVECVPDGREAIRVYQEAMDSGRPFDAVIMDLTIPGGMGGKEAVKQLLSLDPAARAIVSSGYSNDPLMANYREYGFKNVIVKPYTLDEIASVLHQVLKGEN